MASCLFLMTYDENMLFVSANSELYVYGRSLIVIFAKPVACFDKKSHDGEVLLKR